MFSFYELNFRFEDVVNGDFWHFLMSPSAQWELRALAKFVLCHGLIVQGLLKGAIGVLYSIVQINDGNLKYLTYLENIYHGIIS